MAHDLDDNPEIREDDSNPLSATSDKEASQSGSGSSSSGGGMDEEHMRDIIEQLREEWIEEDEKAYAAQYDLENVEGEIERAFKKIAA